MRLMMATPADLEDFAIGFSLTEGIITRPEQIDDIDIVVEDKGIDLQIRLEDEQNDILRLRRRHMAGPVGCGLCGIESIEEAVRPTPDVSASLLRLSDQTWWTQLRFSMENSRCISKTRAVHGAAFYVPGRGLIAVREDVGRHNALDKLTGAAARAGFRGLRAGCRHVPGIGRDGAENRDRRSPVIIAIYCADGAAIRTAEGAGMTLIALVRATSLKSSPMRSASSE